MRSTKWIYIFYQALYLILVSCIVPVSAQSSPSSNQWALATGNADLDSIITHLKNQQLVDGDGNWRGGNSRLVSLGDYGESPDQAEAILDFFIHLAAQAESSGGKLHVLIGEQELDRLLRLNAGEQWLENGKYATFLADKGDFALRLDNIAYAHAGLDAQFQEQSLTDLNDQYKQALKRYLQIGSNLLATGKITPDKVEQEFIQRQSGKGAATGPYRDLMAIADGDQSSLLSESNSARYLGNLRCHVASESYSLERTLAALDVQYLVVGHITDNPNVVSRMDGILIMLGATSEQPILLPIDTKQLANIPEQESRMRLLPKGMTDQDVETFLANGEIVKRETLGVGVTQSERMTLRYQGRELDALFKIEDSAPRLERSRENDRIRTEASDRYHYEIAAYKLDRMLDMNVVAPAVIRNVDGKSGAMQLWLDDIFTDTDREEQQTPFDSICVKFKQDRLRIIFDLLIYNDDRNMGNIAWTREDQMLYLIDHSRAFRLSTRKPKQYAHANPRVSNYLATRLEKLDRETLRAALSDVLNNHQIKAILRRRDNILETSL